VGATDGGGMPEHGRPGAAYVFERQSNGVWQQVAKLLPLHEEPNGPGASNFGTSVAIEGDVIVVGCYFSPQTTVFERRNGVWTRASVLDDTGGLDIAAASIYPTADWDRQSIQADVTPRSYAALPGDRWFGLMVRYIDANNYYYITVRNSNTIQLKRIVNGVVTTLGSAPLAFALNRTYALRLESHGEQLRTFVEGRLVLSARDSALTRGRPGITMYRTRADYDNVILNPDPSVILKDERFDTPTMVMDWDWVNYFYQWVKLPDATVFTQPTTGGGAYAFSYYSNSTDQIIRARLRATQFNGADRWIGLIGRYVDAQNYYYLTLRNSNQIALKKLTNGVITTLDTAALPAPMTVNTWYNLRLDIVGTKLRAYMNGVMMLEATDQASPHPAGYAGVAAYKTAAEADDFLVVQP
jgi:hypothetical protein